MFRKFSEMMVAIFQAVCTTAEATNHLASAANELTIAAEEEARAFRKNLAIESEDRTKRLAEQLKKAA